MTSTGITLLVAFILISLFISVFPACGLKAFSSYFGSFCSPVSLLQNNKSDERRIFDLKTEIALLEQNLMENDCAVTQLIPKQSSLGSKSKQRQSQDTDTLLTKDIDAWKERDIKALSGCWELTGSEQEWFAEGCRQLGCPFVTSSNDKFCFDGLGGGSVTTKIGESTCKSKVKARFTAGGDLFFEELTPRMCDSVISIPGGSFFSQIVKHNYTCKVNDTFSTLCQTEDSKGVGGNISLRRISND